MNHSETVAKGVVESVIPGARMVFRLDQCRSVHDFDLFLPSGMIAAAEATAAVDESEARINGAIESRRKGGSAIKARLCKKDWHIDPDEGANINLIRESGVRSTCSPTQGRMRPVSRRRRPMTMSLAAKRMGVSMA